MTCQKLGHQKVGRSVEEGKGREKKEGKKPSRPEE